MLRRIFASRRKKVRGGRRKLYTEELWFILWEWEVFGWQAWSEEIFQHTLAQIGG
jgi:hypothetical protein